MNSSITYSQYHRKSRKYQAAMYDWRLRMVRYAQEHSIKEAARGLSRRSYRRVSSIGVFRPGSAHGTVQRFISQHFFRKVLQNCKEGLYCKQLLWVLTQRGITQF